MIVASLRARIVGVLSLSTVASCGSSGGTDVASTAPGGVGGSVGAGGGSSAVGGQAGAGASGAAGTDAGGAAGTGGAGGAGAVPCPPAPADALLICYHGGGDLPAGCGFGMNGGDFACYVPGKGMAPGSPCLAADDPSLPALLETPCESVTMIAGVPTCRMAAEWSTPSMAVASCCYTAHPQTMCLARPLLFAGTRRAARLSRTRAWVV